LLQSNKKGWIFFIIFTGLPHLYLFFFHFTFLMLFTRDHQTVSFFSDFFLKKLQIWNHEECAFLLLWFLQDLQVRNMKSERTWRFFLYIYNNAKWNIATNHWEISQVFSYTTENKIIYMTGLVNFRRTQILFVFCCKNYCFLLIEFFGLLIQLCV